MVMAAGIVYTIQHQQKIRNRIKIQISPYTVTERITFGDKGLPRSGFGLRTGALPKRDEQNAETEKCVYRFQNQ